MKITTKENAAGKISGYYVDGSKTRKAEIDTLIYKAACRGEVIEVDYHLGREFKTLTCACYKNAKVVFKGETYGKLLMTATAAAELGYSVIKRFTGGYSLDVCEVEEMTDAEKTTAVEMENPEEYAVTADAQQVAVDAEIALATNSDAHTDFEVVNHDLENAVARVETIAESSFNDSSVYNVYERTLEGRVKHLHRLFDAQKLCTVAIGAELQAAKTQVKHGHWRIWLQNNFSLTERTARNYMAVAARFGNKKTFADFKPATLIALLALSDGDENEFVAANPVADMSTREVKNAVKQFNASKAENQHADHVPAAAQVDATVSDVEVEQNTDDESVTADVATEKKSAGLPLDVQHALACLAAFADNCHDSELLIQLHAQLDSLLAKVTDKTPAELPAPAIVDESVLDCDTAPKEKNALTAADVTVDAFVPDNCIIETTFDGSVGSEYN